MIDVKQAIRIAIDFVKNHYEPGQLQEVALEEVRHPEDSDDWLITVGFRSLSGHEVVKGSGSALFGDIRPAVIERVPRDYKEVVIDHDSGEVKEMRIRIP